MAANESEKSDTTKFLEAAKDFSFEQKLSVVQSILAKIPREQQQPWNLPPLSQKSSVTSEVPPQQRKLSSPVIATAAASVRKPSVDESGDKEPLVEDDEVAGSVLDGEETREKFKPQPPPLIDPYEKSMRYYEKHLILNHFQHMTAKLVLQRPEDTLQFMINWCTDMQKKQEENRLKAKTLYEQNKIDVYEDEAGACAEPTRPKKEVEPKNASFGMDNLQRGDSAGKRRIKTSDADHPKVEIPNKPTSMNVDGLKGSPVKEGQSAGAAGEGDIGSDDDIISVSSASDVE